MDRGWSGGRTEEVEGVWTSMVEGKERTVEEGERKREVDRGGSEEESGGRRLEGGQRYDEEGGGCREKEGIVGWRIKRREKESGQGW